MERNVRQTAMYGLTIIVAIIVGASLLDYLGLRHGWSLVWVPSLFGYVYAMEAVTSRVAGRNKQRHAVIGFGSMVWVLVGNGISHLPIFGEPDPVVGGIVAAIGFGLTIALGWYKEFRIFAVVSLALAVAGLVIAEAQGPGLAFRVTGITAAAIMMVISLTLGFLWARNVGLKE